MIPIHNFVAVRVRVRSNPGNDDARPEEEPPSGLAANELRGTIEGSALQARDIHGDVHFTVKSDAGAQPVPAQLPPERGIFIGRDAELQALEALTARGYALVVVTGIGGSGKSALVTHWARQASNRYPDGILHAELAGHDPSDAASPEVVLTGFLLSLGVRPEQIPRTLADQRTLFRTLTTGRRILVVLDNAATAAQVRVLLPGPGINVVLVTTRWRLAGLAMDGAHFLQLGPLDDQSAARIFAEMAGGDRIGTEPEAVRDVVRLSAGLPLAICVAGALLALRPRRPVSRLAAELANEQERLTRLAVTGDISVISAFDIGYRALSAPAARCYRLLSMLFVSDFSGELADACTGGDASRLIDELVDTNLLEEIASDRLRFHDLVKLHARQRARAESAAELADATTRAIGWYLEEAVRADRVLLPGRHRLNPMYTTCGPGHENDALDWLEAELPGLVAAVHAAHDSAMYEAGWQLCEALVGLFSRRKHFPQWIETSRIGIASALACADPRAESVMRIRLGLAYLGSGQVEQAAAQFGFALDVARRSGYSIGEASALEHLGLIGLRTGEPAAAAEHFRDAMAIHHEIGNSYGVMLMTRRLGEASRDAGQHDEAIAALRQARSLAVEMNQPYHEMQSQIALGQAYGRAAIVPLALSTLNEALTMTIRAGARHEQARALDALARVELAAGSSGMAMEHLTAALAIYTELAVPEAEVVSRLLADLQLASRTTQATAAGPHRWPRWCDPPERRSNSPPSASRTGRSRR
jgi:tetratricopeptide (TPR) repeat protein